MHPRMIARLAPASTPVTGNADFMGPIYEASPELDETDPTPSPSPSPSPEAPLVEPSDIPIGTTGTATLSTPLTWNPLDLSWREGMLAMLLIGLLVAMGVSRRWTQTRRGVSSSVSQTSPALEPGSLLARMSAGIQPVREHLASAIRATDRLRVALGGSSRKISDCARLSHDLLEQASGLHGHLIRASLPANGVDLAPGLHRLATDLAFAAGQADSAAQVSRIAGELRRMAHELEHREGTVTVAYLVELCAAWSTRCEQLARQTADLELEGLQAGPVDTLREDLMGALGQTHALTDRIRDLESQLTGPEKET